MFSEKYSQPRVMGYSTVNWPCSYSLFIMLDFSRMFTRPSSACLGYLPIGVHLHSLHTLTCNSCVGIAQRIISISGEFRGMSRSKKREKKEKEQRKEKIKRILVER